MQPGDACGLGRIYLAFPILISVFLCKLVKTRQPAIPEVKEQSWYLIFLFLIFLLEIFPLFVFLHLWFRVTERWEHPWRWQHRLPKPCGAQSAELMLSGLAEGTFPCFLPSFSCRHSSGCFSCPGLCSAVWFVFPVSGDYLYSILFWFFSNFLRQC